MTITDTNLPNLIINTLNQTQFNEATKSENELYLVTDANAVTADLKAISGYNASVAQTLQHDASGNLMWVNN